MRNTLLALAVAIATIALAPPASAQIAGQAGGGMMPGMMGGGMMEHPMGPVMRGERGDHGRPHEGPLITMMLRHSQDLGLTAEQEKKLREIQTGFAKDAIRRDAEIRVAEIDLNAALEQDRWDLAKIETQVKQIAALRGELRMARIRTLDAGRAVLTPAQLTKLREIGHRMMQGGRMNMQRGMGMSGASRPVGGEPAPAASGGHQQQ